MFTSLTGNLLHTGHRQVTDCSKRDEKSWSRTIELTWPCVQMHRVLDILHAWR